MSGLGLDLAGWRLDEDFARRVASARDALRERGFEGPRVAVVLGSGLGNVVDRMAVEAELPFAEIPGFHAPTVEAHRGRLVQAAHEGDRALILQGRLHAYEGHPMGDVVFGVATLAALGARTLLLTNAAGGLHPDMRPGDLMAITDLVDLHLDDPARGLLLPPAADAAEMELALRAAAPRRLFEPALAHALLAAAADAGVGLRTGTYASLWGPNYEPPAEIGMLRRLGADAVGMSTGPEAAVAKRLGMRLAGISCITNVAVEAGGGVVTHDEVIEVGAQRRQELATLVLRALGPLAERSD